MKRNGHKFNAKPTTVDGVRFASQAEARRYGELKLLEKAGKINVLILQPRYDLLVDNAQYPFDGRLRQVSVGKYVADFAYRDEAGKTVIEDVKGVKTPLYNWKKKHFEAQYGLTITEIGRQRRSVTKAKRAQTPRRSAAK